MAARVKKGAASLALRIASVPHRCLPLQFLKVSEEILKTLQSRLQLTSATLTTPTPNASQEAYVGEEGFLVARSKPGCGLRFPVILNEVGFCGENQFYIAAGWASLQRQAS